MARADFTIGDLEGGTVIGQTSPDVYGGSANLGYHATFGPGTVGRKEAYIAAGVVVLMLIYWRAAKGY